ncbi:MAG: PKD domain-containing protein [Bacteroidetes bacterium]|nr:PKD domain-containing protein [Bacteroidota bacterium]
MQNPSSASAGNDFVLFLNGCDYFTFEGIGFHRTGTAAYYTAVQIGNSSDNNTFKNCWLQTKKINSNSSTGFSSGPGSVIYFVSAGSNNSFINNRLVYGYNGVHSTSSSSGNLFQGNIIDTSGSSGIYMTSQTGLKIIGNSFFMGDFGPNKGHYTSYGMRIESSPSLEISKNKIFMLATNGQVVRAIILANTTSTSSAPTLVNNNWIVNSGGTGDCTGFAVYNCNYIDFYYNNVLITNSLSAGACYYHYSNYTNSNIKLVNNVMVNKGGGFVYNVPGANTSDITTVNYNNLYATGRYLAKWAGTDYSTLSAFFSASRKDSLSVYADPGFISNTDLHVSNIGINGKATPYSIVTDDIDGETRSSTTPDIGADEFFPAQYDAGISKLDSPAAFCAGKYDVKVTFANYGIDTLKNLTINWAVNGTTQKSYAWSGKVAPGANSASLTIGDYTFSLNTPYTFKIWTSKPNNGTDGKTINDTLTITRLTGISGTYSIGNSSSADFKSFNSAITAMASRGVCGPVTFNVADGTYNEQLLITQLGGVSATNQVIFQGVSKDSSKVVLTLPSTTATGNNIALLQLNGADWVTFKHMTFERTGTNANAAVIHILNGSCNNTFTNCQMIATKVTTNNASGVNIWSDQGRDTANTFTHNLIKYGTYGIQYTGANNFPEGGTVISHNVFDSAYTNSVYVAFNNRITIEGNIFRNVTTNTADNFDLNLTVCDDGSRIMDNEFVATNTDNAIMLVSCYGKSTEPMIVANNVFPRIDGVGIFVEGCENIFILHNSFNFTGSTATNSAILANNVPSRYNELKNNNIVMAAGYVYNIYGANYFKSDFNNLYAKGNQFAQWNQKTIGSLGGLVTNKTDSHSVSLDPLFTSSKDLHCSNPGINGLAQVFTYVKYDMDGEQRDATPDIGADEFPLADDDAGISALTSPDNKICAGNLPVTAVITNYGGNSLTSATINWSIGGVTQTAYSWTGNLGTKGADTVTIGNFKFQGNTQPKIEIWTSAPNGKTDSYSPNDKLSASRLFLGAPTAAAGIDKDVCAGDSVQIGPKPNSIYGYEWFDGSNNSVGKTSRIYVSPSITSTYYLEVTDLTFGCSATDTLVVNVNPLPIPKVGTSRTVCIGDSTQIGATNTTGNVLNWTSNPAGFSSTLNMPYVKPDSNTYYILTETDTATGCFIKDSVFISVSDLPTPKITGKNIVCQNDMVEYAVTENSGNTYAWSTVNGSIIGDQTNANSILEWPSSGSGVVQVIETNTYGCKGTSTLNITILGLPTAQFSSDTTCTNTDIEFKDESINTVSRDWRFGDGNGSTSKNAIHKYTKTGTYAVTLEVANSDGCKNAKIDSIRVLSAAIADFEANAPTCVNSPITFNNLSSNADYYNWDFTDGNTSTDETPSNTFTVARDYSVKLIVGNAGCEVSTIKTIKVNALPDASFTGTVDADSVILSPKVKGATYLWDFNDGNSSTDESPIHEFKAFRENVTVTLTVTDANGCENTSSEDFYIGESGIQIPGIADINVYPNPTSASVNMQFDLIKSAKVSYQLYNINGQAIGNKTTNTLNAGAHQIQLHETINLSTGVYFIEFLVDSDLYRIKVIKR